MQINCTLALGDNVKSQIRFADGNVKTHTANPYNYSVGNRSICLHFVNR
jgi:hypothetical protein